MSYLPILTYHRILRDDPTTQRDPKRIAVSQMQFEDHLRVLRRFGYRAVSLETYAADLRAGRKPPRRTFAITFDDGYEDVLTLALPVLDKYGFTATVFAVAGQLGGVNAWDGGGAALLTLAQLKELQAAGLSIGAHTCQHVHLTRVPEAQARMEIFDSKRLLEDALGAPVPLFAYPYGETDDAVDSLAREAGFAAAFATDRAPKNHADNLFRLRRVVVFPRTNAWEVLWKVQRWYPAYQNFKRRE